MNNLFHNDWLRLSYFVQDIADPFFAYCKMHAEKMMARAKRRNWLAIQSYIKKHPENKIDDEKEKVLNV